MMLYQSGYGIHPGKLHVRANPGDNGREFAVIELTDRASLFIITPADADRLIAAAAEAKRLLAPPVIVNSARDCDEQNPDGSGEHCHRGGDHGVHQDSNGDEWRTDGAADLVMDAAGGYADELVVDAGGHVYDATGDGADL